MVFQRRRRAIVMALSTLQHRCGAFNRFRLTHSCHSSLRPSCTESKMSNTSNDTCDSPLTINSDYEWLKRTRPMRIRSKLISTSDATNFKNEKLCGKTKLVHFQRHGQGIHNEIYAQRTQSTGVPLDLSETDATKNPLLLAHVIDAPLTTKGIQQCQEQHQKYSESLRGVEVIIVSPLVRALQTAQITFSDHLQHSKKENHNDLTTNWIAHDGCREELGLLLCNKRRLLSSTKADFPYVDFLHVPHDMEEDVTWRNYQEKSTDKNRAAQRESIEELSRRVYDFLVHFLMLRPERELVVVGHSAWLHAMCNAVLDHDSAKEECDRINFTAVFGQAELRTMALTFLEN